MAKPQAKENTTEKDSFVDELKPGTKLMHGQYTIESFLKFVSVQQLSQEGLMRLGPVVERLAEMEGLDAHKNAVTLRLESMQ